jgi:site-specific recombinase XerD
MSIILTNLAHFWYVGNRNRAFMCPKIGKIMFWSVEMIEQWLTYLSQQGKSQATITSYRRGVAHFARWAEQTGGPPFDPAAVIPRDIDWERGEAQVIGKWGKLRTLLFKPVTAQILKEYRETLKES